MGIQSECINDVTGLEVPDYYLKIVSKQDAIDLKGTRITCAVYKDEATSRAEKYDEDQEGMVRVNLPLFNVTFALDQVINKENADDWQKEAYKQVKLHINGQGKTPQDRLNEEN